MGTIFSYSKAPVLIKKIPLRVWHLRDEVEAVLKQKLKEDSSRPDNEYIKELINEYTSLKTNGKIISINGESEEEPSDEVSDGEAEMAAAINGEPSDSQIIQRCPNITKDKIINAKTILGEIHMDGMHFFCDEKFIMGNSIVVEFLVPKKFSLNADIISCREFNLKTRIISEIKMRYRSTIAFTFLKEGERTLLREFLKSVAPKLPVGGEKKKVKKESSDDEFDELDDLDL
jgi:hypothetical protein